MINNWKKILQEQLNLLKKVNLLEVSSVKIVGVHHYEFSINDLKKIVSKFKNCEVVEFLENGPCGEMPTLVYLKNFCDSQVDNTQILYFHTKGVSQVGSNFEKSTKAWRKLMEYWLIEKWETCYNNLKDGYDCCGINYQDHAGEVNGEKGLSKIFNGNFFWANSDYIKKIDKNFKFLSRYSAENWILSQEHKVYIPTNEYANQCLYTNVVKFKKN